MDLNNVMFVACYLSHKISNPLSGTLVVFNDFEFLPFLKFLEKMNPRLAKGF